MSLINITPYFPFRRMKLLSQRVEPEINSSYIEMRPNYRFRPICHECESRGDATHNWLKRSIRDLSMGQMKVWLECRYRQIYCPKCDKVRVEGIECANANQRVTKRMACYIHDLCKRMTVQEVADHLGLNWKTVKDIDKSFLEKDYGTPNLDNLRILSIDEIAIKKRHQYMTVILDYDTGRVVWMLEGRTYECLAGFFQTMTEEQRQGIEAIAIDMWEPYIKAIQEYLPHSKIVFDQYHVVAAFSRVIDAVRNDEFRKATASKRPMFKGTRYLLLMNKRRIRTKRARQHLNQLLKINKTLSKMYILKDKLKDLWDYSSETWAQKAIQNWCQLARTIRHPEVRRFAKRLEFFSYGILNHCSYPINSAKIEGSNNKIKVIKRKAFGFHDTRYFMLKVLQAFDPQFGR